MKKLYTDKEIYNTLQNQIEEISRKHFLRDTHLEKYAWTSTHFHGDPSQSTLDKEVFESNPEEAVDDNLDK